MKLVRYGPSGTERPALVDGEGRLRDLSSIIPEIDGVSLGSAAWLSLRAIRDFSALPDVGPAQSVRLGPASPASGSSYLSA